VRLTALQEADLQTWMNLLAGDAMRGRDSGSPEILLSAGYIAGVWQSMGLTPVPGSGSFFHPFSFSSGGEIYNEYNVVGYLEGSDPDLMEEMILIGAHYDHVGVGNPVDGDSIYNGADDDASGTVALLGIAKLLAAGERPARSVVFCAWGAEEMGLRGSKAFAANPTVDLAKVVVNYNLEMIGHAEELGEGKVFMTGPEYSDLADHVRGYLSHGGFELIPNPFASMDLFYRSDNASFVNLNEGNGRDKKMAGIPAHTFCTWGSESHYHKPNDEPDGINYANMHKLILALTPAIAASANGTEWVQWTDKKFIRYEGK